MDTTDHTCMRQGADAESACVQDREGATVTPPLPTYVGIRNMHPKDVQKRKAMIERRRSSKARRSSYSQRQVQIILDNYKLMMELGLVECDIDRAAGRSKVHMKSTKICQERILEAWNNLQASQIALPPLEEV